MLDLANKIFAEEKEGKAAPADETENKKKLIEIMEKEGLGGVSFFCFFGYTGRNISEEEHKAATIVEAQNRKLRKEGKEVKDDEDEEEDDGFDEFEYEIFPMASDIAVAIVEDLWPSAIRYFTDAQELEAMSDIDFEDDDEDEDMEDDDELDGQPSSKKQKA